MKTHWLAVLGDHDLRLAKVATDKNLEMKVLLLARYVYSDSKPETYGRIPEQEYAGIKTWLHKLHVPLKKLKIAVSSLGLITRVIALPQMKNDDLDKLITDHIDQYFTLNVQNYVIDYRVLSTFWQNEKPMIQVLLAAYPKERMKSVWSLCQYVGFEPMIIDLSADCLARVYTRLIGKVEATRTPVSEQGGFPGDIAILSLQRDKIEIVLLENGNFFLYSDIELNVEAISTRLDEMTRLQSAWTESTNLNEQIEQIEQIEEIEEIEQNDGYAVEESEITDTEQKLSDEVLTRQTEEREEPQIDQELQQTQRIPTQEIDATQSELRWATDWRDSELFTPTENQEVELFTRDILPEESLALGATDHFDDYNSDLTLGIPQLDLSANSESALKVESEVYDKPKQDRIEENSLDREPDVDFNYYIGLDLGQDLALDFDLNLNSKALDTGVESFRQAPMLIKQNKKMEQDQEEEDVEFLLEDLFVPAEDLEEALTFTLTQQSPEELPDNEVLADSAGVEDTVIVDDEGIDSWDLPKLTIFDSLDENDRPQLPIVEHDITLYMDPLEELENALSPALTMLSELLSFFAARHLGQGVRAIYLSGDYCTLPQLEDIFMRNLGVQTIVGFPNGWKPTLDGSIKQEDGPAEKYASLYGLALRED